MTRTQRILLIIILLLAAALRFYRLDAQSFWNDEGNSVSLAQRSLALVTAGAAGDIHPPGYYYLLWAWIRLVGESEFAARSLSVILGTLLVAVTYALGRQLDRPALGLAAAFLAAISPFQIYYSQEARMYILVTLAGAAATYALVRLIRDDPIRPSNAISYALFTAAGLYTHYSYPVIIAAHNTIFGLWIITTWRRGRTGVRLLRWGAIQLGALILYTPWLPIAWSKLTGYGAISQTHPAGYIIVQALKHYTLGPTAGDAPWLNWILVGFALLTVTGLIRQFSKAPNRYIDNLAIHLLPPIYALAPAAMMIALSFTRPAYRPKFFLVGTPAFHLILAAALFPPSLRICRIANFRARQLASPARRTLGRTISGIVFLFVTLTAIPGLHNYFHNPAYARDDYRGMAAYIQAAAREGDAVLLNAPNQWEVFTYYYGDRPNIYPLPRTRPLDQEITTAQLEEIAAKYQRIFALYWGVSEADPDRFVESWLEAHTYRAVDSWHGDVRLVVYAVPQAADASAPQHTLNLTLGDAIALHGYTLSTDAVEAGDLLQLTLYWQAVEKPGKRYKVFVQLLDSANHIVGQLDSEPGGNLLPTDTWQPGQAIADRYGILVQPGTPPGQHRLIIGMYSLNTGERLPVQQDGEPLGNHILLGAVSVTRPPAPPPLETLSMQNPTDWSEQGLRLLGYDLYKQGFAHQPAVPLHPGDLLHVNLYWQAEQTIAVDWRLRLRLQDSSDNESATMDVPLAGVDYSPLHWSTGEIVRAQFDLFIPGNAASGRYRLEISLLTPDGKAEPAWFSPYFQIE